LCEKSDIPELWVGFLQRSVPLIQTYDVITMTLMAIVRNSKMQREGNWVLALESNMRQLKIKR
jgi:hypothetical protein